MTRVLVVCTANICRSPMGEVLLTREGARRGEGEVGSAGVWATPGLPASEGSVAAMARAGLDLRAHRSRRTSAQLIEQSDLVVTMESRHLVELVSQHPDALDRIFALRELVGLVAGSVPEPERPLATRLSGSGPAGPRGHLGRTDLDVADPIGGSRSQYRRCAAELEVLCGQLAGWMWGPVS